MAPESVPFAFVSVTVGGAGVIVIRCAVQLDVYGGIGLIIICRCSISGAVEVPARSCASVAREAARGAVEVVIVQGNTPRGAIIMKP